MLSRNFCEKSVRENFCNFHTVQLGEQRNITHTQCSNFGNSPTAKIFRQINLQYNSLVKKLI